MIAELAHGFELGTLPGRPAVDGRRRSPGAEAARLHRPGSGVPEDAHRKQIKATLPSPALLGERLWDPEKSAKAYPSARISSAPACRSCARNCELLVREGVAIVQIDDPHLCLFVDPDVRAKYDDPDRAADFAVDMMNEVVDGIAGVKLAVHLCRRAGAGPAARPGSRAATIRSCRSSTG